LLTAENASFLRPFVKWAGGKSQLLLQFQCLYPEKDSVGRYLEPFLGSGAVFFHVKGLLQPARALLTDTNAELIDAFLAVRDEVDHLIELLRQHQEQHCESYYYEVRNQNPQTCVTRAARLIYLNKTGFNGLYRVNSRGLFNVPFGRHVKPKVLDETRLRAAYFTSYTSGSFGENDQRDLAALYTKLDRRGCLLMLSNSDTPLIRELYAGFHIHRVSARRNINSNSEKRGPVFEVVVLNYQPKAHHAQTVPPR